MSARKTVQAILIAALTALLFASAGLATAGTAEAQVDIGGGYNIGPDSPLRPELPPLPLPPIKQYAFCAFEGRVLAGFVDIDDAEEDLAVVLYAVTTTGASWRGMDYVVDTGKEPIEYWERGFSGDLIHGWVKATDPDGNSYGWHRVDPC